MAQLILILLSFSFGISDITVPGIIHGLFLLIPLQDHWFPSQDFSLDILLSNNRLKLGITSEYTWGSSKQVNNPKVLSNFDSLIHSFYKILLSTYSYVPGSVLGTGDPNIIKIQEI